MDASIFNVKFGALEELLNRLEIEAGTSNKVQSVAVVPVPEPIHKKSMCLAECADLTPPGRMLLRCVLRSVFEGSPLGSIPSGAVQIVLAGPSSAALNQPKAQTTVPPASEELHAFYQKFPGLHQTLISLNEKDLFCFDRLLLAFQLCQGLNRRLSTADIAFGAVSSLSDHEKMEVVRGVLQEQGDYKLTGSTLFNWPSLRQLGYPLFIFSLIEIRQTASALSRQYHATRSSMLPEDQTGIRQALQWTLFWAVVCGCSPKAVLAWKRDFYWGSNEKISHLLSADWNDAAVRAEALKVALGHKARGEYLFSAVLFLWLGDVTAACRDCLARGMGDWQLALMVSELKNSLGLLDDLWSDYVVGVRDPWLGVSLGLRWERMHRESLGSTSQLSGWRVLLQLWNDWGPLRPQSPLEVASSKGPVSTLATPALQELEIVMTRKGIL